MDKSIEITCQFLLYTIRKEVRKAISEKSPNLTFAGYVNPQQLKSAYSGSDLFLFPSYEETEGIVVLEALAMKIPVLLRDIPVYTDWLKNEKDVYKAKKLNDFEKIAKSILKYELPDLTEQGYETVQQKNIYHIGKQLSYVYNKASKNLSQFMMNRNEIL